MPKRRVQPNLEVKRFTLVVVLALLAVGSGCATYSDRTENARRLAGAGNYAEALGALNSLLKVEDGQSHPSKFRKDDALMLLERGMVHQASGDYSSSQSDLQLADKQLELLDFSSNVAGAIGKYIYSDSSGFYKISPVERLSLNSINILNYLAEGDLRGARVEVRRFTTMRNFLKEYEPQNAHGAIGSYLAGFVLEQLGEGDSAMHHYDDALEGKDFNSLYRPVAALSKSVSYRGAHIRDFLSRGEERQSGRNERSNSGEILVVVGIGRVPYKIPERMPIGAAVGVAGAHVTGDLKILERSVFKVLVYPELVPAVGVYSSATVQIDGQPVEMERISDLAADIVREYEVIKPKIIAAALTRMITRAIAAEVARESASKKADSGIGGLVSLLAEGALLVADKPDTRSWTLLPGQFLVSRVRVEAGPHSVQVGLGSGDTSGDTVEVDVPQGGYAVVVVTPLH